MLHKHSALVDSMSGEKQTLSCDALNDVSVVPSFLGDFSHRFALSLLCSENESTGSIFMLPSSVRSMSWPTLWCIAKPVSGLSLADEWLLLGNSFDRLSRLYESTMSGLCSLRDVPLLPARNECLKGSMSRSVSLNVSRGMSALLRKPEALAARARGRLKHFLWFFSRGWFELRSLETSISVTDSELGALPRLGIGKKKTSFGFCSIYSPQAPQADILPSRASLLEDQTEADPKVVFKTVFRKSRGKGRDLEKMNKLKRPILPTQTYLNTILLVC